MAKWLGAHPAVTVSRPKEPGYHIDDLPISLRVDSEDDYEKAFSDGPDARFRLDATPWYMFSKTAIPNIIEAVPDARIIVQLREPTEQLISLHRHHVKVGFESEPDVAKALFSTRPSDPSDFRYGLDYMSAGRFGEQVDRMLSAVPAEQVHFVDFARLAEDAAATFDGVTSWLGLAPIHPRDFRAMNRATRVRSKALQSFISRAAAVGPERLARSMKSRLTRLNTVPTGSAAPDRLRRRVVEALSDDIDLLAELTGWDLSAWK